ncbi:MAG TPA: hypothetical protein VM262_09825, partial [Acidimicrobiales bacterium]|nr:hypothetical protein [Acidimicrobiales bacterium]
ALLASLSAAAGPFEPGETSAAAQRLAEQDARSIAAIVRDRSVGASLSVGTILTRVLEQQ